MIPFRRALKFCAFALILSLSAPAEAATGDDADPNAKPAAPGSTEPEKILVEGAPPYIPTTNTIATRLPLLPRYTPANLGTVNEPLLKDQYALILGDALRNISGVNVHTQSGVADYFLLRGYSSLDSGVVMVDGALEPEVPFFQMYNVSRVELLKGPAGFLYGRNPLSGALAGVVNIVRKQPEPGTFGTVGGAYGSYGTFDGTVDYNLQPENSTTGFRINATWRESDFYRDDKASENFAINPSFTWRITPASSLNLNVEWIDTSYSPDSGLPLFNNEIPDVPRERSYQSPFDDSDQRIGRFQADYEVRIGDDWTLRDKLYHRDLDWDSNGTIIVGTGVGFFSGRPEAFRTLTLLEDRQRITGNLFEAETAVSTGLVRHTLLFGVETARYGDDSELQLAQLPSIDIYDPVETATAYSAMPFDSFDTTSVVVAPYIVDQIELHRNFQVLLGARFDWLSFEDDASGSDLDERELSPTAGVIYTPADPVTLYANVGRSFGPPASRLSDPDPDPRESTQLEAGVKLHYLEGKIQATIAAYRLDLENIPIPDASGVTQTAGDQESRGIELEFAAEPSPGLRGFLSYAYNDSELTRFSETVVVGFDPFFNPIFGTADRSGNRPAFSPEHILNLWISKRFDNGFGLGGGSRLVSDQYIWEDNVYQSDSYVTVDAALYYSIKNLGLHLNVKNLTDREFETRSIGSSAVIPADGLAVYGGFQYRF